VAWQLAQLGLIFSDCCDISQEKGEIGNVKIETVIGMEGNENA